MFKVVRGEPTAEELAALVTVIAAKSAGGAAEAPKARSAWRDPAHRVRRPLRPGPGAWRASGWPV